MKTTRPKLIAIIGGSGAGKSWLADRLQKPLGALAARLSLDDFYRVRPHVPPALRHTINFDHPRAIDWPLFETVLRNFRKGRTVRVPHYDFASHTRLPDYELWMPRPLVIVDGLWLLWRQSLRNLFDLTIFIECPDELRLQRRIARDVAERGRTERSVGEQFWKTVAPMHNRYVAPQRKRANLVLNQPVRGANVKNVLRSIEKLLGEKPPARRSASAIVALPRTREIFVGGALSARLDEIPDYALAS